VQAAREFTGPYVATGPYERDDGSHYDVRLERVPGGLRLGQWYGGSLERRAPVLRAADVPALVRAARERSLLEEREQEALERALGAPAGDAPAAERHGASPGRSGDMREELRVEPEAEGMVRIGRWLFRPNLGWELQEAPVMLPAKRYAEALANAARAGALGDQLERPRP
jgi:hypothetical protein